MGACCARSGWPEAAIRIDRQAARPRLLHRTISVTVPRGRFSRSSGGYHVRKSRRASAKEDKYG